MTVSSQSAIASIDKMEGVGVDVPSLMARSRQGSSSVPAPTRERVSQAIALVRARQANISKRPTIAKTSETPELRTLSENVVSSKIQLAKNPVPSTSSVGKPGMIRSPLTPAGQTSSVQPQPKEQGQHQHRMKSEPMKQSELDPNTPTLSDEPEENNAPPLASAAAFLMDPLGLIKREFQLATQSVSRGSTNPTATPLAGTESKEQKVEKSDSDDSDEMEVDAKTLQDVTRILDAINANKKPSKSEQGQSSHDAVVVQQAASTDSDPIQAMRSLNSDDFIYGSDDDVSSDEGSVNPETLAEIGAFIDAVSKPGSAASTGIKTEAEIAADTDALKGVASDLDDDLAANVDAKTEAGIASLIDALNGAKTEAEIASHIDAVSGFKSEQDIASKIDTMNLKTAEEIASHIDAVSGGITIQEVKKDIKFGSEGAMEDSPHVEIQPMPEKEEIRVPSPAEHTFELREKEVIIPSYSVESLGSSQPVVAKPFVEDEKKTEENDGSVVIKEVKTADPPQLQLPVQSTKAQLPVQSTRTVEAWINDRKAEVVGHLEERINAGTIAEDPSKHNDTGETMDEDPFQDIIEASRSDNKLDDYQVENIEAQESQEVELDLEAYIREGEEVGDAPANDMNIEAQESDELELDLEAYMQAGEEIEEEPLKVVSINSDGSDLGIHWGSDPPEQRAIGVDEVETTGSNQEDDDADYDNLILQAFGSAEENANADLGRKLPELQSSSTADEDDDIVTELKSTGLPACPSMNDEESLPWDLKNIASEETMKATGRTKPSERSQARQLKSLFSDDSSVQNSSVCSEQISTLEATEAGEVIASTKAGRMPVMTNKKSIELPSPDILDGKNENGKTKSAEQDLQELPSQPSGDEHEDEPINATKVLQVFDPFAPTTNETLSQVKKEQTKQTVASNVEDAETDDAFVQAFLLQGSMTEEEAHDTIQQSAKECPNPPDLLLSASSGKGDKYSCPAQTEQSNGNAGPGFMEQFDLLGFEEKNDEGVMPVRKLIVNSKGEPIAFDEDEPEVEEVQPRSYDFSTFDGIAGFFKHLHEETECSNSQVEKIKSFQKLVAPISAGKKPTVIETAQIRQAAMRAGLTLELVDKFLDMVTDDQPVPDVLSSKSEQTVDFDALGLSDIEDLNEDEAINSFLARKARPPTDLTTQAGIATYFSYLHEDYQKKDTSKLIKIKKFQKLVARLGLGQKPPVIQAAEIRQTALHADISMELVDKFLELADETSVDLLNVKSSNSEPSFSALNLDVDDIEEVNEDEEINAFLTRFGSLHKGGHFPDANVGAVEEFIQKNSGSNEEEAVEIDATYGYVNKQLEISKSDDEEGEQEWWKEGQERRPDDNDELDPDLVELSFDEAKPHQLPTPKASTRGDKTGHEWNERGEAPIINTKFSTSYDEDDNEDWQRKKAMASYGARWLSPRHLTNGGKPSTIDGVEAAEKLKYVVYSKKVFKNWYPWRRLYKERTRFHPGFHNVDVHSIYESTMPILPTDDEEVYIPWERRRVRQRFLHEKSFSFSRNWFGDLVQKKGNEKIKQPVCKPKSMEMPIENIPDPGEWTEEWYTQWKSPYDNRAVRRVHSDDDYTTDDSCSDTDTNGTYGNGDRAFTSGESGSVNDDDTYYSESDATGTDRTDDDDDYSWEEAPECGEIINVKQKIGERVSRVHPDYTSSLRRSRWRKKYFPRGTFPY